MTGAGAGPPGMAGAGSRTRSGTGPPVDPAVGAASAASASGVAPGVTAVVLTLDEAVHLPDCLASLAWADGVVVLDSGSTDATVAIARAAGATVAHHPFENYSRQRQHALDLVPTPWVLFVDADERVPPALAAEIRAVVGGAGAGAAGAGQDRPAAYWIPRRNDFWGHRLRGGGWWPDHQLRLLRVGRVRYDPDRAVHEVAEVDGPAGRLAEPMVHLNYASRRELRAKQVAYARLEAARRLAAGAPVRPHHFVAQPLRELWRRFVTLGGWRDGPLGLELGLWMAWYELRALWLVAMARRGRGPA